MEQGRLEAAQAAIDANELQELKEIIGMPSNGRVITNTLMLRVNKDTDGALTLKAEMENDQFYYEAIIRVCDEKETIDKEDGWGIHKKKIEGGELLAAFGCGAHGQCVASFVVDPKSSVGSRSRQGVGKALHSKFTAHLGCLVQFSTEDDVVHRAAIVSFALYVPKKKGTNIGVKFGGQTVLIAYVFDSTNVSTHFVVCFGHCNPVPSAQSHSFCVPQHRRCSCRGTWRLKTSRTRWWWMKYG